MSLAYDVIVVGGGLAGLSAALVAASEGASTLVLEKGEALAYACNTRLAMGYLRIGGQDMDADPATLRSTVARLTRGGARQDLLDRLAEEAGSAVDWLRRQGVTTIRDRYDAPHASLLAPPAPRRPGLDWPGRGADRMLRRLEARINLFDGRLMRGRKATAIEALTDGFRIEYETMDGTRQWLSARAIILADGGFQANADLVRQHISQKPEQLLARHAGTGSGDGIHLARQLGAETTRMDTFYGHVQSRDAISKPALWPYPVVDQPILGGIAVDWLGQRFTDEGLGGIHIANAIARLDEPLRATAIFDARAWSGIARDFIIPANPLLVTAGATVHCSWDLFSLEAAAGLPTGRLVNTVYRFNEAAKEGRSTLLSPPRSTLLFMPASIENPPFFAVPLCAGITYTMGGISIDGNARVLRRDGESIPGLFAAGSATGGHEGGPASGYTGGLAKALVFGRVAGAQAARHAQAMVT